MIFKIRNNIIISNSKTGSVKIEFRFFFRSYPYA